MIPSLRNETDFPADAQAVASVETGEPVPGDLRRLMRWARARFGVGSAAAVTCGEGETVDFVAMAGDLEHPIPCRRTLCSAALRHRRPFQSVRPAADACSETCPLFCAGVPITSAEGELIGGVYVFDSQPHRFSVVDMEVLKCLADLVHDSVSADARALA